MVPNPTRIIPTAEMYGALDVGGTFIDYMETGFWRFFLEEQMNRSRIIGNNLFL
jgi:hypothetical protein